MAMGVIRDDLGLTDFVAVFVLVIALRPKTPKQF
jgi:hypothetical protein